VKVALLTAVVRERRETILHNHGAIEPRAAIAEPAVAPQATDRHFRYTEYALRKTSETTVTPKAPIAGY